MDLFNIIPENFFSLLSSKNNRLYVSLILQIFKTFEKGSITGINKKILLDDIEIFLENYFTLNNLQINCLDEELSKDDDFEKSHFRKIANDILRKMEKTGWIFIDIDNDYQEKINFSDYGITIIEALLSIQARDASMNADDHFEHHNTEEFHGYVYTIYSLLMNASKNDSLMVILEVLKNTRLLVRFLRKIDYRLKQYITSVVEVDEIKDLMEKLIRYKTEIFDEAYNKIKTNDNVNRYRLVIIQSLEKILNDSEILQLVIDGYSKKVEDKDYAVKQVYRDINEIIEIFNSLDNTINEIDIKIKTYVNATIGKIKFLLNEEDNIIGKLNVLLKHIKDSAADDKKLNKAVDLVATTTTLRYAKPYNKRGLYSGRGTYIAPIQQSLDTSRIDDFLLDAEEIFKTTNSMYSEESIRKYMMEKKVSNINELVASDMINFNSSEEEVLKLIHAVVYSNENGYRVYKREDMINHNKFIMVNFTLRKEV